MALVGMSRTKQNCLSWAVSAPVAGFFFFFFFALEACTEPQRCSTGEVQQHAHSPAAWHPVSTDVAEPQDRKGSPPESCGASATRKLPGLMGSASLAHVGTRVPFSPHRLDRGTATATAGAGRLPSSPHLHGRTAPGHPACNTCKGATQRLGAWGEWRAKAQRPRFAACTPAASGPAMRRLLGPLLRSW